MQKIISAFIIGTFITSTTAWGGQEEKENKDVLKELQLATDAFEKTSEALIMALVDKAVDASIDWNVIENNFRLVAYAWNQMRLLEEPARTKLQELLENKEGSDTSRNYYTVPIASIALIIALLTSYKNPWVGFAAVIVAAVSAGVHVGHEFKYPYVGLEELQQAIKQKEVAILKRFSILCKTYKNLLATGQHDSLKEDFAWLPQACEESEKNLADFAVKNGFVAGGL